MRERKILFVKVGCVTGVLLQDGWHSVIRGSMDVDTMYYDGASFDFMEDDLFLGFNFSETYEVENESKCGWITKMREISGPLSSIIAVSHK